MKTILITGGSGFIGSHFIEYILSKYKTYNIINIDALTYAANKGFKPNSNRYKFYNVDICDAFQVNRIFSENYIDIVVHFAAETHVDQSIDSPSKFVITNVLGTQSLLEACRFHWKDKGFHSDNAVKFLQISTDEVYGASSKDIIFTEDSPLNPNNPYAATKASADLLVLSYAKTYNFPAAITRCSNNYGSRQHLEKLIPKTLSNAIHNLPIPVYGNGLQKRDWLHVEDHCTAIDKVLHYGKKNEIYNICTELETTNLSLIAFILDELNKPPTLIKHIDDRIGHDISYTMSCSKIRETLGWSPKYSLEDGIKQLLKSEINRS